MLKDFFEISKSFQQAAIALENEEAYKAQITTLEKQLKQEKDKYLESLQLFNQTTFNTALICAWAMKYASQVPVDAREELFELIKKGDKH